MAALGDHEEGVAPLPLPLLDRPWERYEREVKGTMAMAALGDQQHKQDYDHEQGVVPLPLYL